MKLKFIFDNESDIPEAFKAAYAKDEKTNKWVLQADGAVSSDRLAEFRNQNNELKGTIEAVLAAATGKPADEFRSISREDAVKIAGDETARLKREGSAKSAADIEKAVSERTASMKADLEKKINDLTTERDKNASRVAELLIDRSAVEYAGKLGMRATAQDDIISRARTIWKLENGKLVARGPDGKEMYGKDSQPLGMEEWVGGLVQSAGHLFEENKGGGSSGGGSENTNTGGNPWDKDHWNVTRQMQITQQNPSEAQRLEAAAGKKKAA